MNTNTNALRAVEEIADELEVANREVAVIETEKAEVIAKLAHIRGEHAKVEAVVLSGDYRAVSDELLVRGSTCKLGIEAMEKALEVVEARRLAASERGSEIRKARKVEELRAAADEDEKKIEAATKDLELAATSFLAALHARALLLDAVGKNNAEAKSYGVPVAPLVFNAEILRRLTATTGVRVELSAAGTTPGGVAVLVA